MLKKTTNDLYQNVTQNTSFSAKGDHCIQQGPTTLSVYYMYMLMRKLPSAILTCNSVDKCPNDIIGA